MNLRTWTAGAVCAWFAVVLELAWPAVIPRGSLLIPVICAVVSWERSAALLGIGGLFLLLDWIARPTIFPFAPLFLPLLIAGGGSWSLEEVSWRRQRWGVPRPLRLPLLAVMVLAIQTASLQRPAVWLQPATAVDVWLRQMQPALLVLLPISGVIALLLQLAEELGLRKTAAVGLRGR